MPPRPYGLRALSAFEYRKVRSVSAIAVNPTMTFVFVYGALGDLDNAFSWLERCYETQNYYMPFLQSREFDDLWGDPRYAAMKARIGFPPRAASKAT